MRLTALLTRSARGEAWSKFLAAAAAGALNSLLELDQSEL